MNKQLNSDHYDYEAFWSFFYIWSGFLCAQVSSGNCETMEPQKFAILTLKPRIQLKILIILNVGYYLNTFLYTYKFSKGLHALQVKFDFRLKFLNLGWLSISFDSQP